VLTFSPVAAQVVMLTTRVLRDHAFRVASSAPCQ